MEIQLLLSSRWKTLIAFQFDQEYHSIAVSKNKKTLSIDDVFYFLTCAKKTKTMNVFHEIGN